MITVINIFNFYVPKFLTCINILNNNNDNNNKEIYHSALSSFVYGTIFMKKISSMSDIQCLKNDLNAVYKWTESSNMKLNDLKFEHINYGKLKIWKITKPGYRNLMTKLKPKIRLKILGWYLKKGDIYNVTETKKLLENVILNQNVKKYGQRYFCSIFHFLRWTQTVQSIFNISDFSTLKNQYFNLVCRTINFQLKVFSIHFWINQHLY